MSTVLSPSGFETVADLIEHLGGIPPERILWHPVPARRPSRT